MMKYDKNKRWKVLILQVGLLSGCTSVSELNQYDKDATYAVSGSRIASDEIKSTEVKAPIEAAVTKGEITSVNSLHRQVGSSSSLSDFYQNFSDKKNITVTTEKLPLDKFVHYVFGSLLNVSYIVSDELNSEDKVLTLNISEKISEKELLALTESQLIESGNEITYKKGIYYITPLKNGGSRYAIGVGGRVQDIPTNANSILQIVPVTYALSSFAIKALQDFTPASVRFDGSQQSLFIRGRYSDVARTLDIFRYLDKPANRGKHVALFELTYITSSDFTEQLTNLLASEGINSAVNKATGSNLVFVPLEQVGSVAVFSSSDIILKRVKYWASKIDKPAQGSELNYFLYYPKFARATDLASSVSAILSGQSALLPASSSSSNTKNNNSNNRKSTQVNTQQQQRSVSNYSGLVVDERSNAIIFNISAAEFNQIKPLLQQLDVLPKQILLDVTIAEVTLSGEFKKGVEFYLSKGNSSGGTKGAFGIPDIGGLGFLYKNGSTEIQMNAFQENKLVNVLSNPSLLVRDGVSATINIGTDIPVVTSTVDTEGDGSKVTETIQYRKTGVDLSVTPTVNSRGVVIMNISQNISNQTDTSAGSSSPSIFERSITTEVIADSGQTIILGGIITENISRTETKVPLLGDIPLLGELFRYDGDSKTKTELVMLVTPRIIERSDEWEGVIEEFGSGFQHLEFPGSKGKIEKKDDVEVSQPSN